MNWKDVGAWVKKNAGPGAALVGSLVTGNVPGAVAAGVSIISSVPPSPTIVVKIGACIDLYLDPEPL